MFFFVVLSLFLARGTRPSLLHKLISQLSCLNRFTKKDQAYKDVGESPASRAGPFGPEPSSVRTLHECAWPSAARLAKVRAVQSPRRGHQGPRRKALGGGPRAHHSFAPTQPVSLKPNNTLEPVTTKHYKYDTTLEPVTTKHYSLHFRNRKLQS